MNIILLHNSVQRRRTIGIRKRSDTMNIGNQISNIRKEQQLTQEEFG
nr:MAG TPA: Transcriptional regulator [Caudoviricetes sp.]